MKSLMKRWALFMAAGLCLSLAACGNSGDAEDIVGEDWRTTGVVVGSGTITHTGEGSVNVLVTVDESSAAFYRDEQNQILFDSVAFPMTISDAQESFNDISFDDINDDGESDVCVSFVHAPGDSTQLIWIWDSEERYVYREDLSVFASASDADITDYVGLWEYGNENLWLRVYDDSTWEFVNDQNEVIESGTLWADETGLTLFFDGNGDMLQLDRTVSGDLIDSVNDTFLFPAKEIESIAAYFPRNGLEINAAMDQGTYLLENGVSSYQNEGDGYSTRDCCWEIVKNSDDTHDGIREIQFDAICYIPEGNNSYSDDQANVVTSGALYDFYTGMWFTDSTAYDNTTHGENHYIHTIEWNGESEIVEFSYSTDWQSHVGDWSKVMTQSYIVYLPEDYDGLIFAAEQEPDNYWDCAMRLQMESLYPEALFLDISVADPYSSLFFSICD